MKRLKLAVLSILIAIPLFKVDQKTVIEMNKREYMAGTGSNYLSSVSFRDIDFTLDRNIFEYTLSVPFSKSTLGLSYTTEDPDAIVEVVGDEELFVGNNSLVILVTSKDGVQREYDFTIFRNENNLYIANDEMAIKDALLNNEESSLTVEVVGEAAKLKEDAIDALKTSGKDLYYEWKDQKGNFYASLKISSKNVTSDTLINPNIKNSITNAKLIKYLEGSKYAELSTREANIPNGSIYTVAVDENEDIYTLYYYDNDRVESRSLRNNDGKVEFEIKGGIDYALVSKKEAPKKDSVSGFSWILPSVILTVLISVFIFASRQVMYRRVRNKRRRTRDQ